MRLAPLDDFTDLEGLVHLAPGGESPSLRAQADAVARYVASKGRAGLGMPDYAFKQDAYRRCKENAAAIFGVTPGEVALMTSAAHGASQVALSLPWQSGDNVVLEDVEFLSSLLPWTRLRERGVEVRVVRHADWTPEESHYRAAVDGRTRVIAASQVSFLTGVQHNLEALRAIADGCGARLYVDATHAAGGVPVPARLCDFVVSATYKWLLGCQGAALLVWNRERCPELTPAIAGWRSVLEDVAPDGDPDALTWRNGAERLEGGNPAWIAIVYLDVALQYLCSLGMERVYAHDRALSARMHAGLRDLGLPLATPEDPRWRAGNTCFWTGDAERLREDLLARRVLVNGGTGRIRIGTHVWNDERDVDAALAAVELLTTRAGARP